jgi:hypothetical protein
MVHLENQFDYHALPRTLLLIIISCGVLMLSSMTSPREAMNPEIQTAEGKEFPIPIGLSVRGASAGIQADYFEQSIVDAIVSSDVFSGLEAGLEESAVKPYSLNIRIINVDAPSFSYKMTVDMSVVWELTHSADGVQVLNEKIQSSYTGGAFEGGLIGANRVRVAAEGAARENIRIGLEKIALLDLQ